MGSMSIWHWVIVLLVVMMVFGTKKVRTIGGDLGLARTVGGVFAAVTAADAGQREHEGGAQEGRGGTSKAELHTRGSYCKRK